MTEQEIQDRCDAFIARMMRARWNPGVSKDCLLVLADWAREITGADPIADLRGSYEGWLQAARLLHRAGGAVSLVAPIAARAGFRPVASPRAGAIGVIGDARRPIRQWGALHDGWAWTVFLRDATVTVPGGGADILAVWDLPAWLRS